MTTIQKTKNRLINRILGAKNEALSEVKIKIAQDYSAKLLEMGIKM